MHPFLPVDIVLSNIVANNAVEGDEVNIEVCVGCMVILPCDVAGDPAPHVMWERGGHPVPALNDRSGRIVVQPDGALQIENTQITDFVLYHSVASNSIGKIPREGRLFVIFANSMKYMIELGHYWQSVQK